MPSDPVGNDSPGLQQPAAAQPETGWRRETRRKVWRAEYTEPARRRSGQGLLGRRHSLRKNRQQFSDLVKSKKYVNPRMLVACTNCRDIHAGPTDPLTNPRGLIARWTTTQVVPALPHDEQRRCRTGSEVSPAALIGSLRPGAEFRCVNCHYGSSLRTGAGKLRASDASHQYFENDISDHTFITPRKDNPGVANHTLDDVGKGRPCPSLYTRTRGTCHLLNTIAQKP